MGYGKLNADGTLSSANLKHEGMVSLDTFSKDGNGNFYEFYNEDMTPNIEKCNTSIQEVQIKAGEDVVQDYIQDEITLYNTTNTVRFKNVDSCYKYTQDSAYAHQQFCIDICSWNNQVWTKAREIQVQAITEKWDSAKLKSELPTYTGVK